MTKLEPKNYRVPSKDWEVKKFPAYVDWEYKKIKCKVNQDWNI